MNGSRRKALCALGAGVLGPWAGAGALAHQGDQVDEPTPEELADLVERGEVTVRAIEAPVDQAMRQVWEQLRAASREAH